MPEPTKKYPIRITEERLIKRITLTGVFSDVVGAFNIERGLIFTFKLLFSKPGLLVKRYLGEGRFQIFNAFRLLVLTTAISLLAMQLFSAEEFLMGFAEGSNNYGDSDQIDPVKYQNWISDWYNLILWTAIPIYALFSFLFNRKLGYNYAEHMVMQTFHVSALNILTTLFVFIVALVEQVWIINVLLLMLMGYYFWMLVTWLEKRSFGFILKNFLGYILANIVYIIGVGIVVAIVFLT